ncbi:MAG: ankyrin repeat domain-containing protein [Planctomycetota bacterium]
MKKQIDFPAGMTLLDAAKDPNTKRIEQLLRNGADVNQRSENGWSALMTASCYGCKEVVEVLIMNGANIDFADKNCGGQTTLMWAARSGRSPKQKVKMLIAAGADIYKTTDRGSDLLMSAAGSGNTEVVELLLGLGMKPDAVNENGYTALMAAAGKGSPKIIELLIAAGAKVNAVDNRKRTALMFAANGFDEGETIDSLLKFGANPNLKDSEGLTALDRCRDSQNANSEKRFKLLKTAMNSKK